MRAPTANRARRARLLAWTIPVILAALASPCSGQSGPSLLRGEFWADVQPVPAVGDEWPVSVSTARERILDEAAWVFGGMIWGFEFSYTPYDKARALAERFDLVPIGTLPKEALALESDLRPASSYAIYSFVEARPAAALSAQMEGYASDPWKGCQGVGKAGLELGVKGRRAAYIDGLRAAVRSFLQGLEPNKPRLVRGRVVFDRAPSLAVIEGSYTAQVRARAMVIEAIPYKLY
jgi:hypothetical protein